jgi:hypothetical protein
MTLAISVPVRDSVHSGFAFCLSELTSSLTAKQIPYKLFFENGSMLTDQRHRLVRNALRENATQILWLDSDMIFPANTYQVLNQHNKDIVACTYSTRTKPYRNVAYKDDEQLKENSGLHSVDSVGMGIMLTSTQVFKTVPAPWFKFIYSYEYDAYVGEDFSFCELAKEYEFDVYVDVDHSKKCAHLGTHANKLDNIDV